MTGREVRFRPVTAEDTEFLYTVYASTRTAELAAVDWSESDKAAFLRAQFNAQHQAYQGSYQGADFLVILLGDRPIGRLYLARGEREIRIVDIAFASKDENGDVAAFELSDLDPEVREGLENLGATSGGLFNEDDLMAAAEVLDPNSSAALLVWENVWAKPVADAIREAGGDLYDYDRIPHEVVVAAREWAQANA